jgi:hypothetical protein
MNEYVGVQSWHLFSQDLLVNEYTSSQYFYASVNSVLGTTSTCVVKLWIFQFS